MSSAVSGINFRDSITTEDLKKLETIQSRASLYNIASEAIKNADSHRKIASDYSSTVKYSLKLFSIVAVAGAAFIFLSSFFAHAAITTALLAAAATVETLNIVNLSVAIYSLIQTNRHFTMADNYDKLALVAKAEAPKVPFKNGQGIISGLFLTLFHYSSTEEKSNKTQLYC